MTAPAFTRIEARDNPFLKSLRKLAQDSTHYRKQGRVWVEGEHLCEAARVRGWTPAVIVISESFWPLPQAYIAQPATKLIVISDLMFAGISGLESPGKIGYVLDWPSAPVLDPFAPTLVLDRVQDAGNVGSMLRSGAAFGFSQVLALKGSAALWSAKVLRAGMGAHFGLRLLEGLSAETLDVLQSPLLVTDVHQGDWVHAAKLPWPCVWVMGHEGQGVAPEIAARASRRIRIAQPGGEESLNVAAAAAICLHASACAARG